MTHMELLLWARGPAFDVALAIFVFGVAMRLLEIFLLGRKPDYSEAKASGMEGGLRTMITRSIPSKGKLAAPSYVFTLTAGYIFHIGFLLALFFGAAHIEMFGAILGFRWPSLPTPLIDFATVISIVALLGILVHRLTSPLLRFLSTFQDYLVWTLTLLPLLTGYLAYHHMLLPYTLMLALHILSVELLMVIFPFTKLMHAFTLFSSRWYNGAFAARKGVES